MGSKILIINIGSASKKYSVYDGMEEIVFFHFEKSADEHLLTIKAKGFLQRDKVSSKDYDKSLEFLGNYLSDKFGIEIDDIFVLAFRIVAPGSFFLDHKEITKKYFSELKKAEKHASLHITPVIEELEKASKIYKEQKKVGISDSAFHKTKLEESKYYGISKELQDKYDYQRFGYHGISVDSVVEKIKSHEKDIPNKVLVCHLGGGVSITALRSGKSMDNSMGFSPLEGPIMATRSGSVDFTLIQDLFDREKIKTGKEQDEFLFEKSGLLGLSGISNDLRVLKQETFKGNQDARFAVKVYVFNIVKEIGRMVSVMKGVDMIVFTGTIGLRADFMRELILEEIAWFGAVLDDQKNYDQNVDSDYFYINDPESKVKILVCETDEMQMMAKIALKMV